MALMFLWLALRCSAAAVTEDRGAPLPVAGSEALRSGLLQLVNAAGGSSPLPRHGFAAAPPVSQYLCKRPESLDLLPGRRGPACKQV